MGDLVREVDVAVVGGGPGGYTAAFRCAELGLETVVVDDGKRLGGVCLFEGCVPSKALLHAAALIDQAGQAAELGIEFGPPRVSLDLLRKWVSERVVGTGVEVLGGRAVFEGPRQLRVEGDEPQKIRFAHALVATGSAPLPLAGSPPARERVMDPSAALALPEVPERLLVVGGGYVGLEIGTVYAAIGSAVTLVETTDDLLPGVDRDLVRPLARRVGSRFAAVHLGTRVGEWAERDGRVEARLGGAAPQSFDRVLVAEGRRARSDGIGLETTAVRTDAGGAIAVDDRCRTDESRIYAVGDVTGEPMLAHRAMRQGVVAAEAMAGRPAAFDTVAVPAVVFTDPEIAWCGLGEQEAGRAGRPVRVATVPWAASGRAATLGRADGLTKLVLDPESGRVLGVGIVGPGASELIAEGALAVEAALTAEDLAATVHPHPTRSETLMEAAAAFLRGR